MEMIRTGCAGMDLCVAAACVRGIESPGMFRAVFRKRFVSMDLCAWDRRRTPGVSSRWVKEDGVQETLIGSVGLA